jgi:hypothetical protein
MNKVLVVVGYTEMKYWCLPLWPKAFNDLTYKEKELLWVDDENIKGLSNLETGEEIAAAIRNYGIHYARKGHYDAIMFFDVDVLPDVDVIEKLLSAGAPLIGGVHAARGDSTKIIGHFYRDYPRLERIPLNYTTGSGVVDADCVSGGILLMASSIFNEVDYTGYRGPNTIPFRFTGDDEFIQLKIRKELNIKPRLHLGASGWHFHDDGFAYRWYGQKKSYKMVEGKIIFEGKTYGKN